VKELDLLKLYQIAGAEAGALEGELHDLAYRLLRDLKLKAFWNDSAIPLKPKKDIFGELYPDVSAIFSRLFVLLVTEGLIGKVPWLAGKYSELVSSQTGIRSVVVKSARPLAEAARTEIAKKIGPGHRLEFRVRPELIGGIKVQWENGRRIDASLSGLLSNMKEELLV
jgi:F0F1-type ATP synthase delta subunit